MAIVKRVNSRDGNYSANVYKHGIWVYDSGNPFKALYENTYKYGEIVLNINLTVVQVQNIKKFAAEHWPIDNVVNLKS